MAKHNGSYDRVGCATYRPFTYFHRAKSSQRAGLLRKTRARYKALDCRGYEVGNATAPAAPESVQGNHF